MFINPVNQTYLTSVVILTLLLCLGCTSQPVKTSLSPSPTPHTPQGASLAPLQPPSTQAIKEAAKYRQLGLQYRNRGHYEQAIQYLKKSTQLHPQNLSGRVTLGWTQHLGGQEQEAIATLQQVLRENTQEVPALNALGIVYLVSGELDKAVAIHSQAANLKPDNEIAYYNLSLAYHRLQNYQLAIAKGKQAASLEPNNPHPWVALAIIYWDKGDKKMARQSYQKAIDLDSRYRQRWFLEHLEKAGFSSQQIEATAQVLNNSRF